MKPITSWSDRLEQFVFSDLSAVEYIEEARILKLQRESTSTTTMRKVSALLQTSIAFPISISHKNISRTNRDLREFAANVLSRPRVRWFLGELYHCDNHLAKMLKSAWPSKDQSSERIMLENMLLI